MSGDLEKLKQAMIEHAQDLLRIKDEVLELRAWKEKARPLLEDFSLLVSNHKDKDYYKRRMEILDELLKEKSE